MNKMLSTKKIICLPISLLTASKSRRRRIPNNVSNLAKSGLNLLLVLGHAQHYPVSVLFFAELNLLAPFCILPLLYKFPLAPLFLGQN